MAACSDRDGPDHARNMVRMNWNPLKIEGRQFSFKCIFSEKVVELLLFDIHELSLFFYVQNQDEIIESFKKFNSSLEAPIGSIVNHLSDNFLTHSLTNDKLFSFDCENKPTDSLKVRMNSKFSGAKFRWEFNFERLNEKSLRQHVILPLIYCSAEHQLREQELIRLVQAKDKEIDDYKSQGHKLSRKHLATEIFSVESFDEKHRKEIKDSSDQPDKYLYTPLAHKINDIVIPKYMSELFKPKVIQNQVPKDEPINHNAPRSSQNENEKSNQSDKVNSLSQKESRIKELENKLKEEEEKAKKIPKKKKLF